MNSFLYRIAETFYQHHSTDISRFSFVFPNRRAGLFFQQHLGTIAGKPIFSPEIMTVNDCFSLACPWQTTDRLSLLFRLYRIYKTHSRNDESFDSFIFWGEMLLSDFDDVDRYLIDPAQIFNNITDLKEIDQQFSSLTEEQIETIRSFWANFNPASAGKTSDDFRATWKILLPVYEHLRSELLSENLATDAMICRYVANALRSGEQIPALENKHFVFIGFNALNPCEKTLFTTLSKRGQADFYWEYDASEIRDHHNPASHYHAANLAAFPSTYPIQPVTESLHDKEIELIAIPSAVGQVKQVYNILDRLYSIENPESSWIRTAVVLPDESLLVPLLHSLPEQIEKINITMGFPMKATPVTGLIEHIFDLQRRARISNNNTSFYHQTVLNILNHQYISVLCKTESVELQNQITQNNLIYIDASMFECNPLLKSIFILEQNTQLFIPYLRNILTELQSGLKNLQDSTGNFVIENDFLYNYYITLNRMNDVLTLELDTVSMNTDTLMRLIRQLTSSITIPFIGEPLNGLQIMGVLETRGLDFDNLILTSFNEGIFPAKSTSNSFIPYNLRKGFELPTSEYQDTITAYNFYRLIHRAKKIYFLYDSRSEGTQTGEVSRFMHQLHYHYGVNVKRKSVAFDFSFNNTHKLEIAKTTKVMEKLMSFCCNEPYSPSLSASSINCYIDCPLQFYLTRIENINEINEVTETIEPNMFGSIFHKVMENIYAPFKGRVLHSDDLDKIIADKQHIDREIVIAFNTEFFKRKTAPYVSLEGNNLLIASVLNKYIRQVLKQDKTHTPFKYISSEENCKMTFPLYNNKIQVNLKGFIDRIDEKEGIYRILDYKTGKGKLEFSNLADAFDSQIKDRPKFILQTMLYCMLYEQKTGIANSSPGIIYLRNAFQQGFDSKIFNKTKKENIRLYSDYKEDFTVQLTNCLEEIFDPNIPFRQTSKKDTCTYCPYTDICKL